MSASVANDTEPSRPSVSASSNITATSPDVTFLMRTISSHPLPCPASIYGHADVRGISRALKKG